MRRISRTDANQQDIIDGLREVGATVQPLHTVGQGCPDLLVGYRLVNHVLEVKDPSKPLRDQSLTEDQAEWHGKWRGRVVVVKSVEDALIEIGARRRRVVNS